MLQGIHACPQCHECARMAGRSSASSLEPTIDGECEG
jgi:hypothetical protein